MVVHLLNTRIIDVASGINQTDESQKRNKKENRIMLGSPRVLKLWYPCTEKVAHIGDDAAIAPPRKVNDFRRENLYGDQNEHTEQLRIPMHGSV